MDTTEEVHCNAVSDYSGSLEHARAKVNHLNGLSDDDSPIISALGTDSEETLTNRLGDLSAFGVISLPDRASAEDNRTHQMVEDGENGVLNHNSNEDSVPNSKSTFESQLLSAGPDVVDVTTQRDYSLSLAENDGAVVPQESFSEQQCSSLEGSSSSEGVEANGSTLIPKCFIHAEVQQFATPVEPLDQQQPSNSSQNEVRAATAGSHGGCGSPVDSASVGGDNQEMQERSSSQAATTPSNEEDRTSSNLDMSHRESNLDTSDLDSGVRNSSTVSGSPPSELPVLQPLSPTHGSSDLNEQYEYLRRTLSHSRRRYSQRRRYTHGAIPRHGETRHTEGGRAQRTRESRQQHTIGQLRDILRNSELATINSGLETHVDYHGRTYYMDHATRTIAYERSQETDAGGEPDMRARREMLDRRYRSLQRSFRGARSSHLIPSRFQPLSPIMSPDNMSSMSFSLSQEETEALSRRTSDPSVGDQAPPKPRKHRTGKWPFFGRKSSKRVVSQSSSSTADDILPVSSPVPRSPLVDDFVFPSPVSMDLDQTTHSMEPTAEWGVTLGDNERGIDVSVGATHSQNAVGESEEPIPSTVRVQDLPSENQSRSEEATSEPSIEAFMGTDVREVESPPSSPITRTATVAEIGRQHSIMRASGMSESDRAAALKARHRIRATTVSAARRRPREPSAIQERDTDDETNGPQHLPLEEPVSAEKNDEERKGSRRSRSLSPGLLQSSPLKFITRKDLYSFLSSAGADGEEFFANRALMELVQRIRADNTLFEKYQHSHQLVNALNSFADAQADLPEGWEKKLNKQGKIFFIDHKHRLTTFIDPRLPLPDQQFTYSSPSQSVPTTRRIHSVDELTIRPHHTTVGHSLSSPVSSITSSSIPSSSTTGVPLSQLTSDSQLSYEDQVVAFFRQPDVAVQIAQRYQRGVRPQLREIIEDIRLNGIPALERIQLSGSVAAYELALVLSLFEEEISRIRPQPVTAKPLPTISVDSSGVFSKSTLQRKKEAFSTKLQNFKLSLARLGFSQGSRLKFNLRRDHLLEDAYEHMMKSEVRHLQRKRLNISFRGEEGLDYGGPSREFFFLVSREVFNPYYGLFEYSANDTYTVQISPTSSFIQNNLDWFRFGGRLIGLAIAQGFLLDVFFTRTVYKSLLGRPPAVKDLEALEPAFYNSLVWIQENDPEPLDLTFTVEEEAFGQLTTHELKPGGMDIPVVDDNKFEYVDLMIRWRLDRGVAEQMESLKKGFTEVMPESLLQEFDAQELEFLTAGTLEIDVDDWWNNTEYRNGYHPAYPVIVWFWRAVEMFDNEQRLRLLQFVTGTSSVPLEGFKALRGSNGPKKFTIDYFSDIKSLPRSHTCFNRLDLPPYPSFEILFEKLRIAVEEGGTFGIE